MKTTIEQFKDADFLTADEKYKISKHFARFVKNGFQRKDFVKRTYEHLHLHCGFIAHYNIDGFYQEYFNGNDADLQLFKSTLESNTDYEPYADINKVMVEILQGANK
jgi:hypothetical protein